jgi:cytoskeleton protein RodZ
MSVVDGQIHDDGAIPAQLGPGAQLRAAREAAGMSIDDVAQQLKLAPRQVKALEDENFAELPGRTFSRGFLRNYARLLNLDANDLVTHLPDSAHAPALGSPELHSTGTLMAELPSAGASKASFGRWLIPLVLVACIVGAAAYEWYRGGLTPLTDGARTAPDASTRKAAPAAAPATPAPAPSGQGAGTPLPNPLVNDGKPAPQPAAPAGDAGGLATPSAVSATNASAPPTPATMPENAPVVIGYRGPSWTEIRDASGQVIVAKLIPADSVQPVDGTPPFELVLGNAQAVSLKYRGEPIDLAPFTKHGVARLILK